MGCVLMRYGPQEERRQMSSEGVRQLFDTRERMARGRYRREGGVEQFLSAQDRYWKAIGDARAALPFGTAIAYAYSPRENVGSGGGDHIVCLQGFTHGRLTRAAGDPLCKPAAKFWGLDRCSDGREATCVKCAEIAERIAAANRTA